MARDQHIEIVFWLVRQQFARQLDGAQHVAAQGMTGLLECIAQEAVIEACVMGDEEAAFETLQQVFDQGIEGWCVAHHFVGDPGQALDKRRNRYFRIDQRRPARGLAIADFNNADLGDPVRHRVCTGRFQIDKNQFTEVNVHAALQAKVSGQLPNLSNHAKLFVS